MSEEKYIKDPVRYLRETGLLFEINRLVLHPYGVALSVIPSEDKDKEVGEILLWDGREDKEGILYGAEAFVEANEKFHKFYESEGRKKHEEREQEVGFIIQELPDPYVKKNGVPLWTYHPEDENSNLIFTVPFRWLEQVVREYHEMSIIEFLNWYDYDVASSLLTLAEQEDVVVSKETVGE